MVEIVNAQRKVRIDSKRWQDFSIAALKALGQENENVTIAFVSDPRIQQLNRYFRGKNTPTDVLSFPTIKDDLTEDSLGDIIISVQTAERQANANRLPFEREIAQLILHGLLHLSGYDHETDHGEMNKLELKLRRRLKI